MRPSGKYEDLFWSKLHTKIQVLPQNKHRACITKTGRVLSSGNQPAPCLCLNQLKSDHNDQSSFLKINFNVFYLHLVLTSFLFPLPFLITSLCALFSATCPTHLDIIRFLFFTIKPNRCTNFPNLFCHETLHISDSSPDIHQQFVHCTLSIGICHKSL